MPIVADSDNPLASLSGNEFLEKLCKVMNVDADTVRGVTITADWGDMVKVTFDHIPQRKMLDIFSKEIDDPKEAS